MGGVGPSDRGRGAAGAVWTYADGSAVQGGEGQCALVWCRAAGARAR